MTFWEIDRPMNFHGNSEVAPAPISPRNTSTIGVSCGIYDAATSYENHDGKIGNSFGSRGGKAASQYYRGAKKMLHHEESYKPCTIIVDGKSYTQKEWDKLRERKG